MFEIDIRLSEEDTESSKLILKNELNRKNNQIKNQTAQYTNDPSWFKFQRMLALDYQCVSKTN